MAEQGHFFNKMPFEIKFRKIWEPGNPAIVLKPGHVITGPTDLLSQYGFLAPLPFDFHKVDSITMDQEFKYQDKAIENAVPTVIEIKDNPQEIQPTEKQEISPSNENVTMPFDPKNVNWLSVKVADLEQACKFLNIDTSALTNVKPKAKKWELVKLVKKAVGMDVK